MTKTKKQIEWKEEGWNTRLSRIHLDLATWLVPLIMQVQKQNQRFLNHGGIAQLKVYAQLRSWVLTLSVLLALALKIKYWRSYLLPIFIYLCWPLANSSLWSLLQYSCGVRCTSNFVPLPVSMSSATAVPIIHRSTVAFGRTQRFPLLCNKGQRLSSLSTPPSPIPCTVQDKF